MEIRQATEIDLPAIHALIKQYPDVLVQDYIPSIDEFFVAEENGAIVGCCALEIYSQRIAEVRSLVVSPKHQGKGIGTMLIEQCLAKARARRIHEVLSITGAASLFEKQGFGTFKNEKFALIKVLN